MLGAGLCPHPPRTRWNKRSFLLEHNLTYGCVCITSPTLRITACTVGRTSSVCTLRCLERAWGRPAHVRSLSLVCCVDLGECRPAARPPLTAVRLHFTSLHLTRLHHLTSPHLTSPPLPDLTGPPHLVSGIKACTLCIVAVLSRVQPCLGSYPGCWLAPQLCQTASAFQRWVSSYFFGFSFWGLPTCSITNSKTERWNLRCRPLLGAATPSTRPAWRVERRQ
jgi:hypothetical protein